MLSALQRIRATAQAGAVKYDPRNAPSSSRSYGVQLSPKLSLPSPPPPLTARLISLGVAEAPAQRISAVLMDATARLRQAFEAGYEHRRHRLETSINLEQVTDSTLGSHISTTYVKVYNRMVHQWISYLLEDVAPRVVATQKALRRRPTLSGKKAFNQSAVPLLEESFEENAFPSRLEKYELAAKCQMDYRQIHVWFQNRRSRFRKEGKELRRREPSSVGLVELERTVVDALLPPTGEEDDCDSTEELLSSTQSHGLEAHRCSLDAAKPAHAFPSPYPPLCPYDPFPLKPGQRNFKTPWIRASSSGQSSSPPAGDVSDLAIAFARMFITDLEEDCSQLRTRAAPPSCHSTTSCPRAPHPALIRRTRWQPRQPCFSQQPVPAHRDFVGKQLHSSSLCDVVPAPYPTHASFASSEVPRPKRTLPRRLPKYPPLASAIQSSWSTGRRISMGRQSSASSISSKDAASASDCDSPPRTPLSLPPYNLPDMVDPFILGLDYAVDGSQSKSHMWAFDNFSGDFPLSFGKVALTSSHLVPKDAIWVA